MRLLTRKLTEKVPRPSLRERERESKGRELSIITRYIIVLRSVIQKKKTALIHSDYVILNFFLNSLH